MAKSPADPGCRGFLQVVMDRSTLADRRSSDDLPLPQLEFKAEAQDFLDLTHGHSPGWHSVSPVSPVRHIGETVCAVWMSSATSPVENIPSCRDRRSGDHEKLITITSEPVIHDDPEYAESGI